MKRLLILLISFLCLSCASTKISSFSNPDVDFSKYKTILVCGDCQDIEFRKALETDIVNAFTEKSITAISYITIISPVKEYTEEELKKIYSDNKIDAFLTVTIISSSKETVYIPPTTTTNYTSRYENGRLVQVPYTTTSGGYSVSYPKTSFEIILKDINTNEIAFKATAKSEGDEFSSMKTLSKSLAKEIVSEFMKLAGITEQEITDKEKQIDNKDINKETESETEKE